MLAERLLQLVDIPSESRSEAALTAHIAGLLPVTDLGDGCLLARPEGTAARVVLVGHTDTVPAQGNLPGRIADGAVHGLGASDMKAGLAVAIELVRAGVPVAALFFPREELPFGDSALTPLLARHELDFDLAVVMEPTDNTLQGGCLGNLNARWTFRGVAGHSARPWLADNAISRAAAAITALDARPLAAQTFDGLEFVEVCSVTTIAGGVAFNVVPDVVECGVNLRYAPGRSPESAEALLRDLCPGELEIVGHAPSGTVHVAEPLVQQLIAAGGLDVAPKQAWTPVAELTAAGLPAVNFGPGDPAQAHRRDEHVRIDALQRSFDVLEAWLCA